MVVCFHWIYSSTWTSVVFPEAQLECIDRLQSISLKREVPEVYYTMPRLWTKFERRVLDSGLVRRKFFREKTYFETTVRKTVISIASRWDGIIQLFFSCHYLALELNFVPWITLHFHCSCFLHAVFHGGEIFLFVQLLLLFTNYLRDDALRPSLLRVSHTR